MTIISAPVKMHGHPVIASHYTPKASATRPGYVILIQRSGDYLHPFITGWVGVDEENERLDSEWCYGHYFKESEEAHRDYEFRCQRGY
jgi:hypothetical protein